MDVWEEGVIQREAQADESPDKHDQRCTVREFRRREESADIGEVQFLEFSLHGGGGVGAERAPLLVDGFEVGEGEGGGFAVAAGDFVDDFDGFGVFATAHEEFGGFVEGEEEEAEDKHEHGDGAHDDHEVAPLDGWGALVSEQFKVDSVAICRVCIYRRVHCGDIFTARRAAQIGGLQDSFNIHTPKFADRVQAVFSWQVRYPRSGHATNVASS